MVSVKDANAMAEVMYYLKGIRQEDVDKIPKKFLQFLNENASKEYICNFDYNKPLKELNILDETRGIIGMICYNYWCETEEQKRKFRNHLNMNEQIYQEELRKKYNVEDIFKNNKVKNVTAIEEKNSNNLPIQIKQENILKKVINRIMKFFHKNK